jgi:hypothetical protein
LILGAIVVVFLLLSALPGRAEYLARAIAVEGELGPGDQPHVWFEEALGEDPNGGVWALVGTDGNIHGAKSLIRFHEEGDVEVVSEDHSLDLLEVGGASTRSRLALRYRDFPGPITIARTTGTALETIAATGDPVPAPFMGTWTRLEEACIDDAGTVYFAGVFDDGVTETAGLFRRVSPTADLELLWESGSPLLGAGVTLYFPFQFKCDASETGALLFIADTHPTGVNETGVFWRSADGLTLVAVALHQQTRPGGSGWMSSYDYVEINDTLFAFGGLRYQSWFAFVAVGEFSGGTPCCVRSVAPWSQPTPAGGEYREPIEAAISPSGDIAFLVRVSPPGDEYWLFRDVDGVVELIFPTEPAISTQAMPWYFWTRMAFGASGDLIVAGNVFPVERSDYPITDFDLLARVVMSPLGGALAVPLMPAGLAVVLTGAIAVALLKAARR